ncbi:MAG: sel1 repeat family protein, partial [Acidobacteriota bacterium]|nr:sel1 repeat family protein [Acidobacteriota bacterium]
YADAMIGLVYQRGYGVRPDLEESLKWIRKAAVLDEPQAETELGWIYANGVGVNRDYTQAVTWYRKAAEQGNAAGAYGLGVRYLEGQGVQRNVPEAMKWFQAAADKGHGDAAYNLGLIYAGRMPGAEVKPDPALAAKYLGIAAEQGVGDGQCELSILEATGKGTAKDDVAAYKWTLLATTHGTEWCGRNLNALAAQMTPGQIQEARSEAAAWKGPPHPLFNY